MQVLSNRHGHLLWFSPVRRGSMHDLRRPVNDHRRSCTAFGGCGYWAALPVSNSSACV